MAYVKHVRNLQVWEQNGGDFVYSKLIVKRHVQRMESTYFGMVVSYYYCTLLKYVCSLNWIAYAGPCTMLYVFPCHLGNACATLRPKWAQGDDCGLSRCMFTQQLTLASYFAVWLLTQLSLLRWSILLRSKEFSLYRKPQRVCTWMLHVNLPGQLTTS